MNQDARPAENSCVLYPGVAIKHCVFVMDVRLQHTRPGCHLLHNIYIYIYMYPSGALISGPKYFQLLEVSIHGALALVNTVIVVEKTICNMSNIFQI